MGIRKNVSEIWESCAGQLVKSRKKLYISNNADMLCSMLGLLEVVAGDLGTTFSETLETAFKNMYLE